MRVIKFRAWHMNLSQMESDVHLLDRFSEILSWPETYAVMQFTGLCDKNGKEIYEGDILKMDDRETSIGVVVYDGDSFKVRMTLFERFWKLWFKTQPKKNRIEIIGNIFSNPELIKQ